MANKSLVFDHPVVIPVNDDGVGRGIIFVSTGAVLQAAAADELVGQQHTTEVRVLAGTLVEDQLVQEDNAVYTLASHIHTHIYTLAHLHNQTQQ